MRSYALIFLSAGTIATGYADICRSALNHDFVESGVRGASTVVDTTLVRDALFGPVAQDAHPYFYRALLRDPARKEKVVALASDMLSEFSRKHPAATPQETAAFMSHVNKFIGWRMSGDARGKRSLGLDDISAQVGAESATAFAGKIDQLFQDFAKRSHRESDIALADFFTKEMAARSQTRPEIIQGRREEFIRYMDALYIRKPDEHIQVSLRMEEQMREFYSPSTTPKRKDKIFADFSSFIFSDLSKGASNFDDITYRSGLYIKGANTLGEYDLARSNSDQLAIIAQASREAPLRGDLKSYFDYASAQVEDLHESGILPRENEVGRANMAPLYEHMRDETDYHLRVQPYTRYAAEAFGRYIAFQRLRILLPTLAKESPNIIIPNQIVNQIITNHLFDGNARDNNRSPRFREFDAASIDQLDRELLAHFRR